MSRPRILVQGTDESVQAAYDLHSATIPGFGSGLAPQEVATMTQVMAAHALKMETLRQDSRSLQKQLALPTALIVLAWLLFAVVVLLLAQALAS